MRQGWMQRMDSRPSFEAPRKERGRTGDFQHKV